MRWVFFAAILLALAAGGSVLADDAPPLSAAARAVAPETLAIMGARIRLAGVAAPAPGRACAAGAARSCAEQATAALAELVADKVLRCTRARRLGHGVYRGACRLPDEGDPALHLLGLGLLVPDADAPESYRDAAASARAAGRGVWQP